MGACFDDRFFPGVDRAKAEALFRDEQEVCRYGNGHSYSGGIGMANGVVFHAKTFNSEKEAADYVMDAAQKWGPAIGVRVMDERGGVRGWYCGAWCSS